MVPGLGPLAGSTIQTSGLCMSQHFHQTELSKGRGKPTAQTPPPPPFTAQPAHFLRRLREQGLNSSCSLCSCPTRTSHPLGLIPTMVLLLFYDKETEAQKGEINVPEVITGTQTQVTGLQEHAALCVGGQQGPQQGGAGTPSSW